MPNAIAYLNESTASGWERTLYAFLAEKERRSGSLRTVQSYSLMLQHFFGRGGKAPDEVTSQDVFAWAYGTGLSGKQPGSITIGARIACLSSFYRFLIRMKVMAANPCDALERPKVTAGVARGLSGEQIHRLLDVVPASRHHRRPTHALRRLRAAAARLLGRGAAHRPCQRPRLDIQRLRWKSRATSR